MKPLPLIVSVFFLFYYEFVVLAQIGILLKLFFFFLIFIVFIVYFYLNSNVVVKYSHLNSFFNLLDISTSLVVEDDPSTQAKLEVSQS